MRYLIISLLIVFLYACGGSNEQEEISIQDEVTAETILAGVKVMEDSINSLFEQFLAGEIEEIDRLVYHEAINRNLELYKNFPEYEGVPKALDNVAGMYLALQLEEKARDWRDTLIFRYPDYPGRKMALELQVSYYDVDDYQPSLLEKYINLLLAEEGLSEEKKEQLVFRLQHIDLSYMDLLLLQNPDLAQ